MVAKLVLNLSIEFSPIIAFLAASEVMTFIQATTLFVILTFIALIAGFIERKELAWFPLIVAISVIGFGLLTIIFDNPFFIIIKDTIYNGVFALTLFIGLAFNRPLLKPLFKGLFSMTDKGWKILTFRWAIMFVLLTISNEIARIYLVPEKWIIYKGLATLATIIFSLYQFSLSKKERSPDSTPWGMRITNSEVKS
jgi:intracellular septation protein